MENKEKKGFWASLVSTKPCKGSGTSYTLPADGQVSEGKKVNRAPEEIKVLGPGCSKCKSTFAVVEKVVKESGMEVRLTKVDDIEEIMRYNILSTPAVVVDGQVVLKGKVPTEAEVKRLLGIG